MATRVRIPNSNRRKKMLIPIVVLYMNSSLDLPSP